MPYAEALEKIEKKGDYSTVEDPSPSKIERAGSQTSYHEFVKKRDSHCPVFKPCPHDIPDINTTYKTLEEEPKVLIVNGFNITKEAQNFKSDSIDKFLFQSEGASFERCHPNYVIGKMIGKGSYA